MLNWLLRYQPVMDMLDAVQPRSVLDVGSGWYGLSWYWPHDVVQTDLELAGAAPDPRQRAGRAAVVRADATQLPFADGSFDVAVSLDTLEHLPAPSRAPALGELARVSRLGFIVGFPVGHAASRADRRLAWLLRRTPRRTVPPWLQEHLAQEEYPTQELLEAHLPAGWRIRQVTPSGNSSLQVALCYAENLPVLGRVTRELEAVARGRRLPRFIDAGATYRSIYFVRPEGGG